MGEVKLATAKGTLTAAQEISSDQLDTLAHVYCGTKQTLDDTGEALAEIDTEGLTMPSVSVDGCYPDAKEAVEDKFNTTVNNTGETYQRILDSAVLDVLKTNMSSDSFDSDGKLIASKFQALTSIGTWFQGKTEITSFTELKDTKISQFINAEFKNCSSLEVLQFPSTITRIGNSVTQNSFSGCTSLKKVIFSDIETFFRTTIVEGSSPLRYGYHHLYFATNINEEVTEIVVPDGITAIGTHQLLYATSLKSLTIPTSVKSLGYESMHCCWSLSTIIYKGTTAECKNITCGSRALNANATYIQCTDGKVAITNGVIGDVITE